MKENHFEFGKRGLCDMNLIVYLFAFLKNTIYGVSVFFTSELSNAVDVLDILALRFLMSFVVFVLLKASKIVKINVGIKDLCGKTERSKYIKSLLLAAVFEPVLYMLFETLGISMTTNITTGVILSLIPISCCISESILLKEKTTFLQKIFLGIGIIGVIYIAVNTNTADGKDTVAGIVFLFLAIISGSLYMVFSRKSSSVFNAMEITYVATILGMVLFNAINIIRHIYAGDISRYFEPYFHFENMVGFLFLAVISTIVATGMNNFCLARMQVSTMSAFSGISTIVTIMAGILFGGEVLQNFQIIGLTLILIRMVGVSYISIKNDKLQRNGKFSKK